MLSISGSGQTKPVLSLNASQGPTYKANQFGHSTKSVLSLGKEQEPSSPGCIRRVANTIKEFLNNVWLCIAHFCCCVKTPVPSHVKKLEKTVNNEHTQKDVAMIINRDFQEGKDELFATIGKSFESVQAETGISRQENETYASFGKKALNNYSPSQEIQRKALQIGVANFVASF